MSVLQENIRTVAVSTSGSRRLLALDFISGLPDDTRVEVFRLPSRKLNWRRLQFSSACLVWIFCIIISSHKHIWVIPCPFQCTVLECAHPNIFVLVSELQQIQNETYTKMIEVTTRWLKKKSTTIKKYDFIRSKNLDSTSVTRFRESDLFRQCRRNFYQT